MKLMNVQKYMTIAEIIKMKPQAASILMQFGMGCIGCPSSQAETLSEAALVHGMDADQILQALNREDA
jgi:hybrid cluster-associated redox disulfide protein